MLYADVKLDLLIYKDSSNLFLGDYYRNGLGCKINYDLAMFLKFIKLHFKLTNETDFSKISIKSLKNYSNSFIKTKLNSIKNN